MFDDEENSAKKAKDIVIGEDLSAVSIEELEERITALEGEIARIHAEITAKRSSKQAAESFFPQLIFDDSYG